MWGCVCLLEKQTRLHSPDIWNNPWTSGAAVFKKAQNDSSDWRELYTSTCAVLWPYIPKAHEEHCVWSAHQHRKQQTSMWIIMGPNLWLKVKKHQYIILKKNSLFLWYLKQAPRVNPPKPLTLDLQSPCNASAWTSRRQLCSSLDIQSVWASDSWSLRAFSGCLGNARTA